MQLNNPQTLMTLVGFRLTTFLGHFDVLLYADVFN